MTDRRQTIEEWPIHGGRIWLAGEGEAIRSSVRPHDMGIQPLLTRIAWCRSEGGAVRRHRMAIEIFGI
jgi:hypothetical protein